MRGRAREWHWPNNRQQVSGNSTESPETPAQCGQQGCQTFSRTENSFSAMVLGQLDIHMTEKETRPVPHTTHKNQLEMVTVLGVKGEHCNIPRRKTVDLRDFRLGSGFLCGTPKPKQPTERSRPPRRWNSYAAQGQHDESRSPQINPCYSRLVSDQVRQSQREEVDLQ